VKWLQRFGRTGKFRPRLLRDAPLLDAMMTGKSEPHRKGWDTRRAKRSAEIAAHIEALQLDIAMRRGWL
jgi:hypothetical protein